MKTPKKLLVVDDEANIRRILELAFQKEGYEVVSADCGEEALDHLRFNEFNAVLTDATMPGMSGYELLHEIRRTLPQTPVVLMTAFGTIPQAIQAVRDGAFEYVTKPFDLDNLKKIIAAAMRTAPLTAPVGQLQKAFIAESKEMKEIRQLVEQVADSKATVLITGESGVGKEVVARAIHELSPRANNAYVAVSCAALPDTLLESELFGYEKGAFTGATGAKAGRFENADEGTLFLDEIGEIPMLTQVKLLRVLQEREFERLGASKPTKVDVRLITATNRDLQEEVDRGNFRLDLMYRLQVVEIWIPPLRERIADIKPLALHFLAKSGAENGRKSLKLSSEAMKVLQAYSWPGNVRELENAIERAVVLAAKGDTEIGPKHLPQALLRVA